MTPNLEAGQTWRPTRGAVKARMVFDLDKDFNFMGWIRPPKSTDRRARIYDVTINDFTAWIARHGAVVEGV